MRRCGVVWTSLALSIAAILRVPLFAAGALHLDLEGKASLLFGSSPSTQLDASFTVGWEGDNWGLSSVIKVEDGQWTELRWEGEAKPEGIDLGFTAIFDPQSVAFASAQVDAAFSGSGLSIAAVARLERTGAGVGLSLTGEGGSPLRRIELRFNLKRYRDEILEDTFSPGFSYATVTFEFPLAEGKSVGGKLLVDKSGLEELWLQLQPPVDLFPWLSLGMSVTFQEDEKSVAVSPSLSLSSPAWVDFYWGVDWDSENASFDGLRLYGFGLRCQMGGMVLRSLTSLAPEEIALVKPPYWELIGLAWKLPGCCGEGEASAAFYFGEEGLFSVSELAVEVSFPVSPNLTVALGLSLPRAGPTTLTLSWSGT